MKNTETLWIYAQN